MTYKDRLDSLDSSKIVQFKQLYQIPTASSCVDFINRYVMTFDPRLSNNKSVPFLLWPKQEEFIRWLWYLYITKKNGCVDKCRDVGASWLFIAFSVYLFLFMPGSSIGLYTLKQESCDLKDDKSSLFGKIDHVLKYLPTEFQPNVKRKFMHYANPDLDSDIGGSCGDNAGRGGRRTIYLKDEAAFYVHPELVQAAISENSDCIIDVSTHSATGTLFYTKVTSGAVPVFIFDWWDCPTHDQAWYDAKRKEAEAFGTLHIFKREIERDAAASIDAVVCPSSWVNSSFNHQVETRGRKVAGLDVADEGSDTNALVGMDGNVFGFVDEWNGEDVTETAERAFWKCVDMEYDELRYDSIGVGAGIRGPIRKIIEICHTDKAEIERKLSKCVNLEAKESLWKQLKRVTIAINMKIRGWAASGAVVRPNETDYADKTNKILFDNPKAQAYWKIREEFRKTYRYTNGTDDDTVDVIMIKNPERLPIINKLVRELSQPQHGLTSAGKLTIHKKPKGTKSPNLCEAYVISRCEIEPEWIPWGVV